MVSRSTSLQGLFILRKFEFSKISKRRSEDVRKEFRRLDEIRLKTVVKYGSGAEVQESQEALRNLRGDGKTGGKRTATGELTNAGKKIRA